MSTKQPRNLFTDGWNSFWHFALGYLSDENPIIIPIFIIYQLKDLDKDENTWIDIAEFGLGYLSSRKTK
jgi:hypothetical protein